MASGEESRKRTYEDDNQTDRTQAKKAYSNNEQHEPCLKLLVSNFIAGKFIGKGGSRLAEMKSEFNARITVSKANEYYPGTEERIVTVSAEASNLLKFVDYLIDDAQSDIYQNRNGHVTSMSHLDIKIVVTNLGAGLLIGKGGCTIKHIKEDSGARIFLTNKDDYPVKSERIVVISGDNEQRRKATGHVIDKLASEPDKASSRTIHYQGDIAHQQFAMAASNMVAAYNQGPSDIYNQSPTTAYRHLASNIGGGGNIPLPPNTFSQGFDYQQKSKIKTTFYAEMEIPEKFIGVVLGKQGQTIREICARSHTNMKISQKEEGSPNANNRVLNIRGETVECIHNAYKLVDEKVAYVERKFATGGKFASGDDNVAYGERKFATGDLTYNP